MPVLDDAAESAEGGPMLSRSIHDINNVGKFKRHASTHIYLKTEQEKNRGSFFL